MKKLLFAIGLSLLALYSLHARNGCCPPAPCGVPAPACPPAKPICTKTIMVPKTIQVPKIVEVPARKIVCPQPDIIEHIPQPPKYVRRKQPPIPQPDIIECIPQPDKIVSRKVDPIVYYECPIGTNENSGGCPGPACP